MFYSTNSHTTQSQTERNKLKVDGSLKFWREEEGVDTLAERGKPGRVQKTSTALALGVASPASWFHQGGSRGWRGQGGAQAAHRSPLQASCHYREEGWC